MENTISKGAAINYFRAVLREKVCELLRCGMLDHVTLIDSLETALDRKDFFETGLRKYLDHE